ncbi:serine hydrolase [Pseudomonadota bacterium]
MRFFNQVPTSMHTRVAQKSYLKSARWTGAWLLLMGMVLLPLSLQGAEVTRLLIESGDPVLQVKLEELVRAQGLDGPASRGELNLALVIVTDPSRPRLAEINGHEMVYAASLPKIAILLGAAVALEEGRLVMSDALHKDLNDMIRVSCNACATRVLEQVGRQQLLDTLRSPSLLFYDEDSNGGLWVGKDYGPGTAYQRDPLEGLSHGATAFQAARFYYRLYTRTLVSPAQSEMMLGTLVDPGVEHKFVKGLKDYRGMKIYRKSGTWRTYHADSALVAYGGHAYIMIALANNPNGAKWLENLARPMHRLAIAQSWEAVRKKR